MPQTESMRAHNLEVIRRAVRRTDSPIIASECMAILQELGDYVLKWIQGKTYTYQDQTYNLTDSTGCAIYKNGRVTRFKYKAKKQATGPRKVTYKGERTDVKGRDLLNKALKEAPLETMGTYTLAVISAAPYGICVNESLGNGGPNKRGKGWFDDLQKDVEKKFEEIKTAHGYGAKSK